MDAFELGLNELLEKVCERASFDPHFRQLALTDGRRALAYFSVEPLQTDVAIRFVEEGDTPAATDGKTFVLPEALVMGTEMSEDELHHVAGAGCFCTVCCCTGCCITNC